MKAISLWQPWAWAILACGKDVENRIWRTNHRGPLLLHAAQRRPTLTECESFLDLAEDIMGTRALFDALATLPDAEVLTRPVDILRSIPRGGIVGEVKVVNSVKGHQSPWAFKGQYQWVLDPHKTRVLPFKAFKGERGFFEVNYDGLVELSSSNRHLDSGAALVALHRLRVPLALDLGALVWTEVSPNYFHLHPKGKPRKTVAVVHFQSGRASRWQWEVYRNSRAFLADAYGFADTKDEAIRKCEAELRR